MSPPSKPTDNAQDTAEDLLETARRCRRLAEQITDRQAVGRLLEMAKECEERAAALGRGTRGSR